MGLRQCQVNSQHQYPDHLSACTFCAAARQTLTLRRLPTASNRLAAGGTPGQSTPALLPSTPPPTLPAATRLRWFLVRHRTAIIVSMLVTSLIVAGMALLVLRFSDLAAKPEVSASAHPPTVSAVCEAGWTACVNEDGLIRGVDPGDIYHADGAKLDAADRITVGYHTRKDNGLLQIHICVSDESSCIVPLDLGIPGSWYFDANTQVTRIDAARVEFTRGTTVYTYRK